VYHLQTEAANSADGRLALCKIYVFQTICTHGHWFFGTIWYKKLCRSGCKITKGYVCVFVCFSTRAIHLEATSDHWEVSGSFLQFLRTTWLSAPHTFWQRESVCWSLHVLHWSHEVFDPVQVQSPKCDLALETSWRPSNGRAMGARCQKLGKYTFEELATLIWWILAALWVAFTQPWQRPSTAAWAMNGLAPPKSAQGRRWWPDNCWCWLMTRPSVSLSVSSSVSQSASQQLVQLQLNAS